MHLQAGTEFTRLTIKLVRDLKKSSLDEEELSALLDLERWILATRDLAPVFDISGPPDEEEVIELEYDVATWYEEDNNQLLRTYNNSTSYVLAWNHETIKDIVSQSQKMYLGDIELNASRVIFSESLRNLWRGYSQISS